MLYAAHSNLLELGKNRFFSKHKTLLFCISISNCTGTVILNYNKINYFKV